MIKLFHNDMSVCAQKVRMVLDYKEIHWESEHLNLRSGDQFHPNFQKINPKGVVPVLMHKDAIITESNAIIEYIDEVFPNPPLMPSDPVGRAKVRNWLIRLDAGLHENIAVISFCVAFRYQMLERYPDSESMNEFLSHIHDPSRANVMRDVIPNGLESPRLIQALYAYQKLLRDMETTLGNGEWLAGNQLTLADYSLLPYVERLEQLAMSEWWKSTPCIDNWLQRLRKTPAYRKGMANWHSADYIELMTNSGKEAWPKIDALINSL